MKASKKILIAVIAVVLVAAIVLGVGYIVLSKKVPTLNEDAEGLSDFSTRTTYTVVKAPYIQSGVMETRTGIQDFWTQNKYSYGVELFLQLGRTFDVGLRLLHEFRLLVPRLARVGGKPGELQLPGAVVTEILDGHGSRSFAFVESAHDYTTFPG